MTCVVSRCSIVSVRMSVLIGRRTGGARGPNGRNQAARHDRSRLTCREGMTAGGATPPGPARREPEGTAPRRMRNPAPPRSTHHVRIAGADGLDWTGARWGFTAASASGEAAGLRVTGWWCVPPGYLTLRHPAAIRRWSIRSRAVADRGFLARFPLLT